MSILKGALERLLAEAQSSKQKELEQVCSTAVEQLLQEIDTVTKENASIETNLKDKQDRTESSTTSNLNGGIVTSETSEKEGKTKSSSSPGKSIENASPSAISSGNGRVSLSSSLFARAGEDLPKIMADNYWQPFRIACGNSMPNNIRNLALDCLQKVIAHGLFKGSNPIAPPKNVQIKKKDQKIKNNGGFSETNNMSYIDISTPFDNKESNGIEENNLSNFPNPARLIDDVVHTVCIGFIGPQTDQTVQLQILKVLLTLVTTEQCPVHGISLLKIIQTCCNIYCYSKSMVNQATAKAELTQISNAIVARWKEFSIELSKQEVSKNVTTHGIISKAEQINKVIEGPLEKKGLNENHPSNSSIKDENYSVEAFESDSITNSKSVNINGVSKLSEESSEVIIDTITEKEIVNEESNSQEINNEIIDEKRVNEKDDSSEEFNKLENEDTKENGIAQVTQSESSNDDNTQIEPLKRRRSSLASKKELKITIPPLKAGKKLREIRHQRDASRNALNVLRKDLYLTFRLFCRLSMRSESNENSQNEEINLRGRSLVLELILSMLDNSGPIFHTDELFINLIRQSLCVSLSQNGVSSNEQLFELSLSNFLMLLRYYRAPLKTELEVLFSEIYLRFLDMSNATYQQKHLVLQGLMKICQKPQILLDIYLNYDCDFSMASVFERIVTSLSKISQIRTKVPSGSAMGNLMDLERKNGVKTPQTSRNPSPDFSEDKTPVIFSKNPLLNVNFSTLHANSSGSSIGIEDYEDNPAQYQEIMSRKQTLREGIKLFNTKPLKGLNFLLGNGFLKNDTASIISFLSSTPGLNKAAIGEYLGEGDPEAIKIMHAFVDRLDFTGLGFVDALRIFLQTFRLPGESQKIDRIMEKFADRYCENNPDVFANADTAYILAYSVIMLNTDQHSAQVKRRMDKSEFIRNNRGINNNNDLPDEFLGKIFEEIANNEIVMEEEQISEVAKTAISHANDRERQELYEREISQMQKKSQALLKSNREGHAPAVWRSASHADHVKPMFAIVCWPLMATLSLIFEDAYTSGNFKAAEFIQASQESVELCLEGFLGAIRISSIFRMDVERDAFVSSLAKLTGLNHVDEMRSKNVAAIKTLLTAANSYGEGLQSSWLIVLKTVSTMERYQLIDSSTGSVIYTAEGVSGLDYSSQNNKNSLPSSTSFTGPSSTSSSTTSAPHRQSVNRTRRSSLGGVMKEFQSQSTIIAIDRIFTNSVKLSGDAIVHFFNALCSVSLEEVNSSRTSPRMYSLQRIVEIAYYNMSRIRFEWTQIWKILQPHFNTVGCHPNNIVAIFAIDSLRQLSMKFLERDELSHYNTQSEFMKPFEHIIKNNPSPNIHDLIIQSFIQMISARAKNIKSGWKSIFVVFGRAASDENPQLVENTFGVARLVYQKHLDLIGTAFVDFVNCVVEFAFNAKEEELVNEAIRMLQGCVKVLVKDVDNTSEKTENKQNVMMVIPSISEQSTLQKKKLQHIEEEQFFLKWFPVVSGLSRLVIDSESQTVRNRALEALFDILKSTGHLFEINYWIKIFRNAIMPIFEDLKEPTPSQQTSSAVDFKRRESTAEVWIQTIRLMVDLYARFHEIFVTNHEFLIELLDLLVALLKRRNEKLGQTGIRCFHNLIARNGIRFDGVTWGIVTTTLEEIFKWTTPKELLEVDTVASTEIGDNNKDEIISAKLSHLENGNHVPNGSSYESERDSVDSITVEDPSLSPYSTSQVTAITTKVDIDFPHAIIKCAAQLIAIQSVQDLALNDTAMAWSKEHVHYLAQMPAEYRNRWLRCLYVSYKFAHNFNANHDLRHALWRAGYVQQMPNLTKQETLALSVFLSILYDLYRTFGDADQDLLPPLVEESTKVLERFIRLINEPASSQQQREMTSWSPLVITVLRELCKTKWDDGRRDSDTDLFDDDAGEIHDSKTTRLVGLRKQIPDFYRLAIKIIGVDKSDVRVALQEFLEKIGNEFLNVDKWDN
ncbi:11263_t:CDS:2 [Funneliformis mosseae]|uniref:11263_t:CDS:1 n=1 Tax=Funneliformis mosseae TaxID=27381 RepID=A0A9N9AUN9_FUNMO|nr:11263_t:CDS:2 [Funneliformis mosseae]